MDVYKLNNKSLTQLSENPFSLEKEIQTLIEENISQIFGYVFVSSEFEIGNFRLDSLCFDEETNSFVIIEYKKGSSYSVIDQGYSYLSTMLNNKAEFILEYNEKNTTSLKRNEVDWSSSKVIFVSPSFNSYQKNSVNFKDVPFELWEIKRFDGGLISLERHKPTSKERIETMTADKLVQSVSKEVKVHKEEDVLAKTDANTKKIWEELKEKLSELGDTEFVPQASYMKFSKNGKGICYFKFRKTKIRGQIVRGAVNADGKPSKNFFVIDDPKNICTETHSTFKSGYESHRYVFDISKSEELDYVEMLIKQRYKRI